MIYLLFGENEFLKKQRLDELVAAEGATLSRIDGEDLTIGKWQELLIGQTLFSVEQLTVVRDLSQSEIWSVLPEVTRQSENTIVLLEPKVDKRTRTYKWLQKNAKLEEFLPYTDRDKQSVVSWAVDRASTIYGLGLDRQLVVSIIDRLGYDQMRLDQILNQLSLAGPVDQALIDAMIPLPKTESVFGLLAAALNGQHDEVKRIVAYLELTDGSEGAYLTFGLLVSQIVILNGLVLGGSQEQVAKDFSANPYAVRNMASLASKLRPNQLNDINNAMSRADVAMKTTSVHPWLIIENTLIKLSLIQTGNEPNENLPH